MGTKKTNKTNKKNKKDKNDIKYKKNYISV